MRRPALPLRLPAALLAVAAVLVGGCGDDAPSGGGGFPGSETAASALRSELVAHVRDELFLDAIAVRTSLVAGAAAPATLAAQQAASAASGALAATYGETFGARSAQELSAARGPRVGALVAVARAGLGQDAVAARRARAELASLRGAAAAEITRQDTELPRDAARTALRGVDSALAEAAEAYASVPPTAVARIVTAARRSDALATLLAQTIARKRPEEYPSAPDAPAAALRAELTGELVDEAYLNGLAATAAVRGPALGATTQATSDALLEVRDRLQETATAVFGQAVGDELSLALRDRARAVLAYARAKAARDQPAARVALTELQRHAGRMTEVLGREADELDGSALRRALGAQATATAAAIRAAATASPKAPSRLAAAAALAPDVARIVAAAVTAQLPDKLPAD